MLITEVLVPHPMRYLDPLSRSDQGNPLVLVTCYHTRKDEEAYCEPLRHIKVCWSLPKLQHGLPSAQLSKSRFKLDITNASQFLSCFCRMCCCAAQLMAAFYQLPLLWMVMQP
jgi:hypothetical protein